MAARSFARPLVGASRRSSFSSSAAPRAWASTSTSSWSRPSVIPPKPAPVAKTQAASKPAYYKAPTPVKAYVKPPVKAPVKAPVEASPPKEPVAAAEPASEAPAEAVSEPSVEAASEAPAEAVSKDSAEAVSNDPVEAASKDPAEAISKGPVEAANEAPAEAANEAPAEAASEAPTEASPAEATSSSPAEAPPAKSNDTPIESPTAAAPTEKAAAPASTPAEPKKSAAAAPPPAKPAKSFDEIMIQRTLIPDKKAVKTSSSSGSYLDSMKTYPSNSNTTRIYPSNNKTYQATTPATPAPASKPPALAPSPAPAPAAELHDPSAYASMPPEVSPALDIRTAPPPTRKEMEIAQALAAAAAPPKPQHDHPQPRHEIDWVRSFHGISEQPFSERAAHILSRPLNVADIEVKPDGIVYLPEIKYRRILNAAFGPGGWAMVPRGDPIVRERIVTREYALIIGGRFIAQAQGESTFFSAESIPASVEACKSNALMRCSKDIGIASELWDPVFIRAFRKKNAEQIWCEHVVNKTKRLLWTKIGVPVGYPFKKA